MKGLLNFLSSPAGQRFGAGMRGLSAGLLQAGAPRVGAPGPNAWGAGLSGFSQGIEAEREKARAKAVSDLNKLKLEAEVGLLQQQTANKKRFTDLLGAPPATSVAATPVARVPSSGGVSAVALPPVPGAKVAPGYPAGGTRVPGGPSAAPPAPTAPAPPAPQQAAKSRLQQMFPWVTDADVQYMATQADPEAAFAELRKAHMDRSSVSTKDRLGMRDKALSEFEKRNQDDIERVKGYDSVEMIFSDPSKDAVASRLSQGGVVQILDMDGKPLFSQEKFHITGQGAQDMALIFSVMRQLDPGSTVREGEYGLAANVGGAARGLMTRFMGLMTGDGLPPEARRQLVKMAYNQASAANARIQSDLAKSKKRYQMRGKEFDPEAAFYGAAPDFSTRFNPKTDFGGAFKIEVPDNAIDWGR